MIGFRNKYNILQYKMYENNDNRLIWTKNIRLVCWYDFLPEEVTSCSKSQWLVNGRICEHFLFLPVSTYETLFALN